jgi:hypothetical protein
MVDWKAVGLGFLAHVVLGFFAFLAPGVGHIAVGLAGGFLTGYIAEGDLLNGAWNGLIAGALGGILLAGFVAVALGFILELFLGGGLGFLGGAGALVVGVVVAVILAVDSAIGGAIGAAVAD